MDAEFARQLESTVNLHIETAEAYVSAQNVVCVVHLSENVDLRKVAMRWHNKYVPQKFEACIVRQRWRGSQATILLFRTGNAVCVGTKSTEESMLACHTLRLELYESHYKTMFGEFRPVNGVYSFTVPHCVDLAKLLFENQQYAQWEPEVFPGLELDLKEHDAVVRVFDSGNCVLMGVSEFSRRAEITRAVKTMLKRYKDNRVPEDERFEYRNAQKNRASLGIKTVAPETKTATKRAASKPPGAQPATKRRKTTVDSV